jgi:hypothetical protein
MNTSKLFEGFEFLIAVVMKSYIFWDITPCGFVENQPTFRRNMSHTSSGSKSKPSKNQHKADSK